MMGSQFLRTNLVHKDHVDSQIVVKFSNHEAEMTNFSNYTEHNPIDIPDNNPDFRCSDDVTMISGSARGMPNSEALSSSREAEKLFPDNRDEKKSSEETLTFQHKVDKFHKSPSRLR